MSPLPVNTSYTRRPIGGKPIHDEAKAARLPTGFLVRTSFPVDDNGDIIVYQGLIVAEVNGGVEASEMTGSQPYYVPWSATAAYGTGSDTAVGILAEWHDLTVTDWQVAPVCDAWAYEKRCYCGGGPLGSIPASVKTDLSDIKWRT
jgi:hypothetical protein